MVAPKNLQNVIIPPKKLQHVVVPPFFMCPISLDLMRDPVTLSTGMTYDRSSIETWLDDGNRTCPATMQVLDNTRLIPNHTLRRLIQEWCVLNQSRGVERIPTPKIPVQPEEVKAMLLELQSGTRVLATVKKLRNLARESEKNKRCVADAGALQVLVSTLSMGPADGGDDTLAGDRRWFELAEEILATIVLVAGVDSLDHLVAGAQQFACICWTLQRGRIESKVNAAIVLEGLIKSKDLRTAMAEVEGVIEALVGLLAEQYYPKALKASLKCLYVLCELRRNRIKAVEMGAVSALVEILPSADKRTLEKALKNLEVLSTCAEGREAISEHALAIPMLVKLILKTSESGAEHVVATLWMTCMYSTNCRDVRYAVQDEGFTCLLLLLQTNCTPRAKQKAVELLKLLGDAWLRNPCNAGKKGPFRIAPF